MSMRGYIPTKGIAGLLHINQSKVNLTVIRGVLEKHKVPFHTGPKGTRFFFKKADVTPEAQKEILERLRAASKRPEQIGVAHPNVRPKRKLNGRADAVSESVHARARRSKGALIVVAYGENKTFAEPLEEAREVYERLGEIFSGE